MILDSSAVVAIFLQEPGYHALLDKMAAAPVVGIGGPSLVEAAMIRLMEGRTVVVIAHRLTTAQRCDRIGVVTGGRLAELGTHDDLVRDEGHYAALFQSWSGGLTPA